MKESKSSVFELTKSESIAEKVVGGERSSNQSITNRECLFKRTEEAAERSVAKKQWEHLKNHSQSPRILSINEILKVLDFPKSTYIYWHKCLDQENPDEELEAVIIEICAKHKDYGYRRKKQGYIVNQKKVQRLMKKLGLNVKSFTHKSRKYNSWSAIR